VGASGCGKSTAVGLLERFYDPLIGDILVDGVALSAYNLTDYRKNISVVSQEPTSPMFIIANDSLYQGTVKFNILLGATRDEVTQEEIDKACREANVNQDITLTLDLRLHSIITARIRNHGRRQRF
jgi:ATP-binding cassette, subfamily B (MDR/TAP), member 1